MPRTINWSREKQGLLLSFSSTHDLKYTNVFHFTEYKTYLKHLLKYRFVGLIPGSSDSKAYEFLFLRSSQGCYAGLNVLYHTHHLVKKKKKSPSFISTRFRFSAHLVINCHRLKLLPVCLSLNLLSDVVKINDGWKKKKSHKWGKTDAYNTVFLVYSGPSFKKKSNLQKGKLKNWWKKSFLYKN